LLVSFHRSIAACVVTACAVAHASAARLAGAWQRCLIASALALSLIGAFGGVAQPAYAANCVNVVLRDPYWGQYRRIVESGWNAAGIGNAFARSGFAVDGAPEVGDIMVWPANYFGASRTGHVAVVAAVYGNGTVLVRHENWPIGSAEHAQVFAIHPANQFVHRAFVRTAAAEDADETPGDADEEA
jgi:surface antigen